MIAQNFTRFRGQKFKICEAFFHGTLLPDLQPLGSNIQREKIYLRMPLGARHDEAPYSYTVRHVELFKNNSHSVVGAVRPADLN